VHVPFWQVSAVQRLPVSHGTPLATGVRTQPVAGSQLSTVHGLLSLQTTGSPTHTPVAAQRSLVVQALLSLQGLPTWLGSGSQVPLAGLHLRHWPQFLTGPGRQVPFWHVSPSVHGLPSSHGVPVSLLTTHLPVAGSHTLVSHRLVGS